MPRQRTISPVDGSVYVERQLACTTEVDARLDRARGTLDHWRATPLQRRCELVLGAVEHFESLRAPIAEEISWQIGRPIQHAEWEVDTFSERARGLVGVAESALGDVVLSDGPESRRLIKREPLGLVLVITPWNFPYLCAVNAVVPALLAGNAVVIKHSDQTPLCAERLIESFAEAGLPDGVLQYLHMNHDRTGRAVADSRVDYVNFTGSERGGHAIVKAAAERFLPIGLELGAKDSAYVAADAELSTAVERLVSGAFFNSGQASSAVERIYVARQCYDEFVEAFVSATSGLVLGDPLSRQTTMGPVVRRRNAVNIRRQITSAIEAGARPLVDEGPYEDILGGAYLAPQVLVDVNHSMAVMTEETFGPVVGIMAVDSDEQAIALMNDSRYGLTASLWTEDRERAAHLGDQLQTGTVYMNCCATLDPELAWSGVKCSGLGCTMSRIGFERLTRPKSFNFQCRCH